MGCWLNKVSTSKKDQSLTSTSTSVPLSVENYYLFSFQYYDTSLIILSKTECISI